MKPTIHINTMRTMLKSGERVSIKFWEKDGNIVVANDVICTSSFHHGNSFNIKFLNSGQFRKVRAITVFEINDLEVFI
jgi:hypothetical protein